MSKAVEQFEDWYENKHVPVHIIDDLWDEAIRIDREAALRYEWARRKGIDSEMRFAQALCSIITFHEDYTGQSDNQQIPE